MKEQIVLALAVVGLMTGCASNRDHIGTQFSELPPAVQQTLNSRVPPAEIADIDKETHHGRTVYEITYREPGKNPKIHIAEDGRIVKFNERVVERSGSGRMTSEMAGLPAPVQATIQQRAPNAIITDIDKETRTGRTVYEITFEEPGKNPKLHVAEDGTIVKEMR